MTKFTFTLLSILLAFTAFAQNKDAGLTTELDFKSIDLNNRSLDTIQPVPLSGCDTSPILLGSNNGGWVSGTNGYGDLEKAQKLTATEATSVNAALILFGGKNIVGSPDAFSAKIYSVGSNGSPASLLGTSQAVSSADIDTSGGFTRFDFSSPVDVNGEFFVAVEVATGDDEIGIAHTGNNCGGGSAWEMWDNNMWFAMNDQSGWGLDVLFFMFAEVGEPPVNTSDMLIAPGSHFVFPNPVSERMTIMYSLSSDADVSISVMDMQGRLISSAKEGIVNAGTHNVQFNVADFATGMYIYQITTNETTVQGKFTVK